MKKIILIIIICFAIPFLINKSVSAQETEKEVSMTHSQCIDSGGRFQKDFAGQCRENEEYLGRVVGIEITGFCCKNKRIKNLKRLSDRSDYCEKDAQCRIREGACGPEAMNIYFDNRELVAMQPHAECIGYVPAKETRCELNKCIGIGKSDIHRSSGGARIMCPMDAKLCPDGSYVGRIPPNCEFKKCP